LTTTSAIAYLDQPLEIWGSGFGPFEPVVIQFEVGFNTHMSNPEYGTVKVERQGPETITLGFVDASAGGAFSFTTDGVLGNKSATVNLLDFSVVNLMALGLDGSEGSVPLRVIAETPEPPEPPEAPSYVASAIIGNVGADGSFQAGVVPQGGLLVLIGGGFKPLEHTGILYVKGVNDAGEVQSTTLGGGTTNERGVFEFKTLIANPADAEPVGISLDPGFYTVRIFGIFGTEATVPLWVSGKPAN